MRESLAILGVFLLGVLLACLQWLPELLTSPDLTHPALLVFMFLAGLAIGAGKSWLMLFTKEGCRFLLLPIATTFGTFLGVACASLFLAIGLWDCLAIGGGFGYYSLSSIFMGQYRGPELGTIALVANILRELAALVLMPVIVAKCGKLAAISVAGSTSVDTALPAITRFAGPEWAMPAIAHGILLDLSVPFWVSLFCSLAVR